MRRVVVASDNAGKLAEMRRQVKGVARVDALSCHISPEIFQAGEGEGEEDEPSFEAIACGKARRWSAALPGELVVATDGGLLMPGLGAAWDPRRTRRFAGAAVGDRERADALLALAAGLERDERRIDWREALAVARDGEVLTAWVAQGPTGLLAHDYDPTRIAQSNGFWIPELWVCPEFGGRRLAELSDAERGSRNDHWARLGAALRRYLLEVDPVG